MRFCIVSSKELVVLDSLENSKQYKNAGKRFRVYGALTTVAIEVAVVGAIHTRELDRSEIDLSPKRSECERSNAN